MSYDDQLVRATHAGHLSLGERLRTRENSFDVLRLIAASDGPDLHAWILSGHREPGFVGTHETLGFVGVLIFFAISGFLVTQSWVVDPRVAAFTVKRALRILPALFVSSVLTAYLLGTIITELPLNEYLLSGEPARYVAANTTLLLDFDLPGVFVDNPLDTVNGSLGTLPVEVKAYALLALTAMVVGALAVGLRVGALALLAVAVVVSFATGVKPASTLVVLFCVFAGAAALYLVRDRIRFRVSWLVAAIAVWFASYHVPLVPHAVLTGLSLPYIVIFFGFRGLDWLRPLTKPGDVSYGIYIWAFPIEQTVIAVWSGVAPLAVIAVAGPATYVVACLSWRLVERPALRAKRYVSLPAVQQLGPRT